jgi:hypothetical protein
MWNMCQTLAGLIGIAFLVLVVARRRRGPPVMTAAGGVAEP